MTERLQKVLAHAGVASRRAAERMILDRRVRVNGAVIDELGTQVDPELDRIEVDGRKLPHAQTTTHHYRALNKPVGVVSTASDPQRRLTVVELVRAPWRGYPVGRLDIDSEGLVLLTDDGELTFRLTQARYGVEKEYHVLVAGANFEAHLLERVTGGVMLEDGLAKAIRATLLSSTARDAWVRIVLVDGRQRQVRRMLGALGYQVEHLRRVRIGPLVLGQLNPGQHRPLAGSEIVALRAAVGLDAQTTPRT